MARPALLVPTVSVIPIVLCCGCSGIIDKQASAVLKQKLGHTSVTVYPAFVRRETGAYDANAAARIGDFLTSRDLARVTVSDAHVPIKGPWHANQAAMLRESAAALADYVAKHPIDTEYALLPEYLLNQHGKVVGIHCYVLDAQGRVAFAVLLNSHHEAFRDTNPTGVLLNVLDERLSRAGK